MYTYHLRMASTRKKKERRERRNKISSKKLKKMPYLQKRDKREIRRSREGEDQKRKERQKVYHSARWRRLSSSYLLHHPLCEICQQKGIIKAAEDVHHIDSFTKYEGLEMWSKALNPNNLMALCKECHTNIHLHEKKERRI